MQALREKYMPALDPEVEPEVLYISGKQAEEVGYAKLARRQAQLQGMHVLVLDCMCVRHRADDPDVDAISEMCAEITDLDIGGNLFESFDEVVDLCRRLPKLRSLTLDGNRFGIGTDLQTLPGVQHLSLSRSLLDWDKEVARLIEGSFPSVSSLLAANNELSAPISSALQSSVQTVDLAGNAFTSLSDLSGLLSGSVQTLLLKDNPISSIGSLPTETQSRLRELDLRRNAISSWDFINDLHTQPFFANLNHLRIAGNPLHSALTSTIDDKPLSVEDGYMLTIARLPRLEHLNYSKISEKERLNAEVFYLQQIAAEIARAGTRKAETEVVAQHPRWKELCDEYGEPAIARQTQTNDQGIDPNSLAARLVSVTFVAASETWTQRIPKAFDTYSVLGLVGKRLAVAPLKLRLILETGERDPMGIRAGAGKAPEYWDSSDEEDDEGLNGKGAWVAREVELTGGTRSLGTFVEGSEARVRVETR